MSSAIYLRSGCFFHNRSYVPAGRVRGRSSTIPNTYAQAQAPGRLPPRKPESDQPEPTERELLEGEIALMRDELATDWSDGLVLRIEALEERLDALC